MRTFVGVLALFGVVLCLLVGGGYLYLNGQIPDVSIQGTHGFRIRAENQADAETVRPELETAASRFAALLGHSPEFEVALLDGPKEINAASILLAVRREMGAPLSKLPLPFPTARFSNMMAAQDTAARTNYRQALSRRQPDWTPVQLDSAVSARYDQVKAVSADPRSLGHEAGHWMLAIYAERWTDREHISSLPVWLVEGIAGYCEAPERRLFALSELKAAVADGNALGIDSLTKLASAESVSVTDTRQHELNAVTGAAEDLNAVFYAECAALVGYLEQSEPGLIKRMTDAVLDSGKMPVPLTDSAGAFFEWVAEAEAF
jgi:hypothetical protein